MPRLKALRSTIPCINNWVLFQKRGCKRLIALLKLTSSGLIINRLFQGYQARKDEFLQFHIAEKGKSGENRRRKANESKAGRP
jgi:hypothetical protein